MRSQKVNLILHVYQTVSNSQQFQNCFLEKYSLESYEYINIQQYYISLKQIYPSKLKTINVHVNWCVDVRNP